MDSASEPPVTPRPSLAEASRVWLRIGLLSFGGPAGQIALMHRMLVEERRWIGERRFLHALNYCMLLPGPEAQQLATYVGWLMHRTAGGVIAGVLFILPGALVMLGLSIGYALFGQAPLATSLFLGVKAAVLAVVLEAVIRIGRRTLKNRMLFAVAAGAFLAIFLLHIPFPLIILFAGLLGWVGSGRRPDLFDADGHGTGEGAPDRPGMVDLLFEEGRMPHAQPSRRRAIKVLALWLPLWLAPPLALLLFTGPSSVWTQMGGFFATMGVATFGGAYAALAYVAQAAVGVFHWLEPGEMGDGLGLAETTPGPLILVLQFVGFLAAFRHPGTLDPVLAGALGALLTTWVTFAPSFLWIFLGGPYMERLRNHRALSAALSAITAAVVGVILNLGVWFALNTLFGQTTRPLAWGPELPVLATLDWRAAVLAVLALILVLKVKLGMLRTLAVCAAGGVLLGQFGA